MKKFSLNTIQKAITEVGADAWLFCDFMGNDPIGRTVLGIQPGTFTTRRWFYYIPAQGAPQKLVHSLESKIFNHLPGNKEVYISWQEMHKKLEAFFKTGSKVAVQYSPHNAIPMISKIDAGIYEMLSGFGVKLVTSGDLVQRFEACLSKPQMNTHLNVAGELAAISEKTFRHINRRLKNHEEVTELRMQAFLQDQLQQRKLVSDVPQIISAAGNTSDPHYYPDDASNKPIRDKTLVQISLRAKENNLEAVYASTAWVAWVGKEIPTQYVENFALLKRVRDAAVQQISQALKKDTPLRGWEVDAAARKVMEAEGRGDYYLHRTGHALGTNFIGHGVHLDNLEIRDERLVIPELCFTITPGLYYSDYGMKTEINIFVNKSGAHLSTPRIQEQIYHIKL
ncbi:MAG: aminopeptidase P family protein [Calditrichales bacterium]|nr:MAG: aminopeptidase P family protein [Calditrichales bacterium]